MRERERLLDEATWLKMRLREEKGREVAPHREGIQQVAVEAIRIALSDVGRKLLNLAS